MAILAIPWPPGIVTACFFILFDLFMLTLLDALLSNLAAHYYNSLIDNLLPRIRQGLDIRRCTIAKSPWQTNLFAPFLLGPWFNKINFSFLLIKIGIIILIFFLDANTESRLQHSSTYGTFFFDPAHPAYILDGTSHRVVARRPSHVLNCRTITHVHIRYHHLVFNLSSSLQDPQSEVQNASVAALVEIDDNTLSCLSPQLVQNVPDVAVIIGCSPDIEPPNCYTYQKPTDVSQKPLQTSVLKINWTTNNFKSQAFGNEDSDTQFTSLSFPFIFVSDKTDSRVLKAFPLARNVFCLRVDIGVSLTRQTHVICLVVTAVEDRGGTLLEIWSSETETLAWHESKYLNLSRAFPGPLFQGNIRFTDNWPANFLFRKGIEASSVNYVDLSGLIINNGLVYARRQATYPSQDGRTITTVETIPLFFGFAILFVTVVGAVVLCWLKRSGGRRPLLNTIDGMSVVLNSLSDVNQGEGDDVNCQDRPAMIGMLSSNDAGSRIGPVRSPDDGERSEDIL